MPRNRHSQTRYQPLVEYIYIEPPYNENVGLFLVDPDNNNVDFSAVTEEKQPNMKMREKHQILEHFQKENSVLYVKHRTKVLEID